MVAVSEAEAPAPVDDNIVYVSNPVYLPYEFEGDGRDGGVGRRQTSRNRRRRVKCRRPPG